MFIEFDDQLISIKQIDRVFKQINETRKYFQYEIVLIIVTCDVSKYNYVTETFEMASLRDARFEEIKFILNNKPDSLKKIKHYNPEIDSYE